MNNEIIAALDVGSTKISCFIAEKNDELVKLIGFSQISSFGINRGVVVNMDETARAIAKVVDQASNMADVNIESISVCVGGKCLDSKITNSLLVLNNKSITSEDVEQLKELAKAGYLEHNKKILHVIPIEFSLDDYTGITNPINMIGSKLEATVNIISAKEEPLRNVIRAVELAGLYVENIIASSVANGYSALIEDEKQLGACLIDIGGFNTDISIYYNNKLVLIDSIDFGAFHITADIAKGLSCSLDSAERIKSLEGVAISNLVESGRSIDFVKIGEEFGKSSFVSQAFVCSIIQPRMEEILEHIRARISKYQHLFNNRIVITGGAVNLRGIRELSQMILNSEVRIANVKGLESLTNISSNPRFITVAGGILYLNNEQNYQKEYAPKYSKLSKLLFKSKKSIKKIFISS